MNRLIDTCAEEKNMTDGKFAFWVACANRKRIVFRVPWLENNPTAALANFRARCHTKWDFERIRGVYCVPAGEEEIEDWIYEHPGYVFIK